MAIKLRIGALALGAVAIVGALAMPAAAQAEDFFSALFGGFQAPRRQAPQPYVRMPFGDDSDPASRPAPRSEANYGGGGQAWCVRTCDGRYFPLAASGDQGSACNNFCPASPTAVVYGSGIDNAATDSGKPYSELPNAFKYRTQIVDACTCNGKDQFGLAPVKIENDATLRKGDVVAGADGLVVVNRTAGKRAELNFSPAPQSIQSRYQYAPVIASE